MINNVSRQKWNVTSFTHSLAPALVWLIQRICCKDVSLVQITTKMLCKQQAGYIASEPFHAVWYWLSYPFLHNLRGLPALGTPGPSPAMVSELETHWSLFCNEGGGGVTSPGRLVAAATGWNYITSSCLELI